MVSNQDELEILSKMRTLLALERNYLAEERTALAKLRTGLALVLVGPSLSALDIYKLFSIPNGVTLVFDLFVITFFIVITLVGVWMSFTAQAELKRIRKKMYSLRIRESELAKTCKPAQELLGDFLRA